MARGYTAGESNSNKPRAYFEKISKAVGDAARRIAELKGKGRVFDMEVATNALERAMTDFDTYNSKRSAYAVGEVGSWNAKSFGLTDQEASKVGIFGTYLREQMDDLSKEINKPGRLFRPNALKDAKATSPASTEKSIRESFPTSFAEFSKQEKDGEFAKEMKVSEAATEVARITDYFVNNAIGGKIGSSEIENGAAKAFKQFRDKGVSAETSGKLLTMAMAGALIKIKELDEAGKKLLLKQSGY
jgi:hypothetical protein